MITARGARSPGHAACSELAQRKAGLPETVTQPGTVVAASGSAEQRKAGEKARGFGVPAGAARTVRSAAAETAARTAAQRGVLGNIQSRL